MQGEILEGGRADADVDDMDLTSRQSLGEMAEYGGRTQPHIPADRDGSLFLGALPFQVDGKGSSDRIDTLGRQVVSPDTPYVVLTEYLLFNHEQKKGSAAGRPELPLWPFPPDLRLISISS